MDLEWKIGSNDIALIKALVGKQTKNALVKHRRATNLAKNKTQVRRIRFWRLMVGMRLTSVQRSGPDGHVARFIRKNPFPLSYEKTSRAEDVESFIANELRKPPGGIRFVDKIAEELAANFRLLEEGEWARTLKKCNRLTRLVSSNIEREVADYIQEKFRGFGPKQARNLLQALGLTRFEVPIDSRVIDWLNEFGFPVRLNSTALADNNYYIFVSEGIQVLCAKSGVFPCILDAAIFSLKDGDSWNDTNVL